MSSKQSSPEDGAAEVAAQEDSALKAFRLAPGTEAALRSAAAASANMKAFQLSPGTTEMLQSAAAIAASVRPFRLSPGTAEMLRSAAAIAASVRPFRLSPGTTEMLQSAAAIAASVKGFQPSPGVADALRTAGKASAALKGLQLPPGVAGDFKRFEKIRHDLITEAAPTFQVRAAFAEKQVSPIVRTPVDVAALVDPPSAHGSTLGLIDGQQQTNALLEKAVEMLTTFASVQLQLLDLERDKTIAAEGRGEAMKKENRHLRLVAWGGLGVGIVGAVATVLALF
jgi:hypothetical protein